MRGAAATRANHSATHLVHEALRRILGDHVAQKGSSVGPDRLRFDFSHTKPMSAEEIRRAEELANAIILQNTPVETRLMALEDARETGAMALFGEKYGDEVRVVSMGLPDDSARPNKPWSIELCGGTHVRRTGDIGLVHIVAEQGSSAGVRRIEALTGDGARAHLIAQDERLREVSNLLRAKPDDVVDRLKTVLEERRALERQLADARKQIALAGGGTGGGAAAPGAGSGAIRTLGGHKVMTRVVQGLEPKDLRGLIDEGKAQIGSGIVAMVGVSPEGKTGLAVGVTADLAGKISAVDLVKVGAEALGGKGGGGRPDFAQAGGPDPAKAEAALEAIAARIAG